MKFSDKKHRDELDTVHVLRTTEEMETREEFNSNLWELVEEEKGKVKNRLHKNNVKNLYKTPARDVKIGEDIYSKNGEWIGYRVE